MGWLREVAPYIHAFREKTFVIAFAGELALDFDQLENLIERCLINLPKFTRLI